MKDDYLFPELANAISKGFVHDFEILSTGALRCLTECTKPCFELHEVTCTCVPIISIPMALLFLIDVHNGLLKGTLIHYPEDYS